MPHATILTVNILALWLRPFCAVVMNRYVSGYSTHKSPPPQREKINKLRKIKDFFLNYIHVDYNTFSQFKHRFYTVETWYRIAIGQLLPQSIDRVLYLDCDMIVLGDISTLYYTNLQERLIGVYYDVGVYPTLSISTGIPVGSKYFNAGMLLLDLKKWRNLNTENDLRQIAAAHNYDFLFNDQDVLNIYTYQKNNALALPKNYNFVLPFRSILNPMRLIRLKRKSVKEITNYRKQGICVILHYIDKPWSTNAGYVSWSIRKYYYDALKLTPWRFSTRSREKIHFFWQRFAFPFIFLYRDLYHALYWIYKHSLRPLLKR